MQIPPQEGALNRNISASSSCLKILSPYHTTKGLSLLKNIASTAQNFPKMQELFFSFLLFVFLD